MASRFSVYIHYPWCRHRCPYCDFAIAVADSGDIPHETYATAVIEELYRRADRYQNLELATIYIGGGTPSLWAEDQLSRVLAAVRGRFAGTPEEITLEANPTDCTEARLAAWRQLGIERLSVGVQSFSNADLSVLGRDHRMGDGQTALDAVAAAGFASFSIDLMLSVPGASSDPGLERAIAARVPHLSVYELTIEERTPLAAAVARGEVLPLADDVTAERYLEVHDRLTSAGYEHYEVSSYALPGHRSRHNQRYWQLEPYLGVGNGAASLWVADDGSGERRTNVRSVGRYLAGGWEPEREIIPAADMELDRIWLGLRSRAGVEEASLPVAVVDWLLEGGLAERVGDRIQPTIRGFMHHDGIARRVVTKSG